MKKAAIVLVVLAVVAAGCTAPGPQAPASDENVDATPAADAPTGAVGQDEIPVAKIGDQVITRQELELAYKYLPEQVAMQVRQGGPSYLLDKLVEFELCYQEALDRGLDKDPEIADQLKKTTRQFFYQALMTREAPHDFDVSEDEIKAYYDQHKTEFMAGARAKATHILVTDEETAKEVVKKAKAGEDFADLVMEYSIDPTKPTNKGDLGWFPQGRMLDAFDKAVFSSKPGDVVGPVQTVVGFHVIHVDDMKDAGQASLDEVHDQIEHAIKQEKADAWRTEFLDKIKAKYPVALYPENLPQM